MSEHRVEGNHRDREDQHDPEQASELTDVIAVATVTLVAAMAAMVMSAVVFCVGNGVLIVWVSARRVD
ncbi:hypothetical protein BJ980_003448 [Nocardioides daedukensis]|uniref:Uncharacterized protein n=1 Tax=Nocardioides daedukensis TaxID=634462 RepID=A0A7Y9UW45_9ACTN|nr:hypothetical protein [Nocardioides daedukensis]NYG60525.1 hypothetical protein [Nocardioides daedukensis]